MKKKIIIIILIVLIALGIVGIYSTFASNSTVSINGDNNYDIILSDNSTVIVPANSSKIVYYQITNTNRGRVKYAVGYTSDSIEVKVYWDTPDSNTGFIDYGENKFIKLKLINDTSSDDTVTFNVIFGYENGGQLPDTGDDLITDTVEEDVSIVNYVTNLYNNYSNKVTATNDSIDYYYADIYDKDTDDTTSGGLMNDRLGGVESLESGIGNIRYYGANPNNYIDIGDRDSSDNIIPWRIIGLFKNINLSNGTVQDLIKIIRTEPLSSVIDWSSSTNDWHNANIQLYLKNNFYENLSSSVKDKTIDVYWNLGAHNTSTGLYPADIYDYERGNSKCSTCTYDTTWSGRVALMYASDYGYASDLNVCAQDLANYQNDIENCRNTNWLYDGITQWLLTQNDDYNYLTWLLNSQGSVMTGHSTTYDISYSYKARPVLFLGSDLLLETGHAGTESDPYRISAS